MVTWRVSSTSQHWPSSTYRISPIETGALPLRPPCTLAGRSALLSCCPPEEHELLQIGLVESDGALRHAFGRFFCPIISREVSLHFAQRAARSQRIYDRRCRRNCLPAPECAGALMLSVYVVYQSRIIALLVAEYPYAHAVNKLLCRLRPICTLVCILYVSAVWTVSNGEPCRCSGDLWPMLWSRSFGCGDIWTTKFPSHCR